VVIGFFAIDHELNRTLLTGFIDAERQQQLSISTMEKQGGSTCPGCGSVTLVCQEGCMTCLSCGYSKCS
ncbi:MAG: hypothetical protein WCJ41_04975, partial [Aestuariivirga sp.]|uniref:hypothetical protein n=1 Tax=Aestuariivirga sp. TaxID=2650926 RepID=UPI00301690A5